MEGFAAVDTAIWILFWLGVVSTAACAMYLVWVMTLKSWN